MNSRLRRTAFWAACAPTTRIGTSCLRSWVAYIENGRKPSERATDEGDPDIHQFYVDLSLSPTTKDSALRIGRQEISFGASRLVSKRDSPNIRRSFDAVKMSWPWRTVNMQAFVARPVELRDGPFDDKSETAVAFWGIYGSLPRSSNGGLDIYYLGLDREIGIYDQGTADETRHTIGARLFGNRGGWRWDAESAFQFGDFGDGDIRAWFAGGEIGHSWSESPWSPHLALRMHAFSGDRDPDDSDLETFNPLFPKTTFFTQLGLFSPANAVDVHPMVSFSPTASVRVTASVDFFWRFSTDDALYRPPLLPRISGNTNDERYLGTIAELLVKWSVNERIQVTLAYDVGNVQGFIADAGGKDPRLFLASVQIDFG